MVPTVILNFSQHNAGGHISKLLRLSEEIFRRASVFSTYTQYETGDSVHTNTLST